MTFQKKSLGQHWLKDRGVLNSICELALVHEHDTVLEIGPGLGTLTDVLLDEGAAVVAVEIDESLARKLRENIDSPRLEIVSEDILKFDLRRLPNNYKVVANIPYYLTSHLIKVLSESANPPKSVTLLVQKEVAQRICAQAGAMSVLGVSAQFYFDVELGEVVPAKLFTPPPKVDSQIVHMLRKQKLPEVNEKQFFRIVKAGFSNRRKTLLNSLSAGLDMPKDKTADILAKVHIDPQARPQELSIEQWVKLTNILNT